MKIIKTDCTDEQIKEDMPELLKLHAEACEARKTQILWEFFGGDITLSNGHKYQVMSE